MFSIFRLSAALALVTVTVVGLGGPAEAHTAVGGATCSDGAFLDATSYDGAIDNTYSLTLDQDTRAGTFGASVHQMIPVPQDGAVHTWAYAVEAADGAYHFADSGQVGPCGPPPVVDTCPGLAGDQPAGTMCTPPADDVVATVAATELDCNTLVQLITTITTRTPFTFDQGTQTWVRGTPVVTQAVTSQPVLAALCVRPPDEVAVSRATALDCATTAQLTTTTTTTTPFVYDRATQTWVRGNPVATEVVTSQPVPASSCAQPPAAQPPAEVVTTHATALDCDTREQRTTTTTTTTPFVLDQATQTWVHGTPVVAEVVTSRPAHHQPCAQSSDDKCPGMAGVQTGSDVCVETVAVQPPTEEQVVVMPAVAHATGGRTAHPPSVLPATGAVADRARQDSGSRLAGAGALGVGVVLLAGLALRRRRVVTG